MFCTKNIDICTKKCYHINMNTTKEKDLGNEQILNRVCLFLNLKHKNLTASTIEEQIKELCVAKLCGLVGISGAYNYKSKFFNFFSSIVAQAVCDILGIKLILASDELRLFKYNHINLIDEVKYLLNTKSIDEAFLDSFDLIDRFKFLIK